MSDASPALLIARSCARAKLGAQLTTKRLEEAAMFFLLFGWGPHAKDLGPGATTVCQRSLGQRMRGTWRARPRLLPRIGIPPRRR